MCLESLWQGVRFSRFFERNKKENGHLDAVATGLSEYIQDILDAYADRASCRWYEESGSGKLSQHVKC